MIRATFREALRGLRSRLGKRGGQVSILKFGCSVSLRLPLAAALLAGLPLGAAAQDSPLPPVEYTSALGLLETGDTTGALALLRAATRSDSLFGPAFLRLGVLTTALLARAGAQHDETALADETRWALERARELLGPDPELVDTYWRFLLRREAAGPAGLVPFAAERFLDPVEQHSPGGWLTWLVDGYRFEEYLAMAKAHEQSWEAGQNRLHEYMVDFDETLAALQDELGIGLLSPGPFRDASIKDPSEHFAVAGSAWAAMRATPYTPDAPQECLFPTARAAVECAAVPGIVPPAIRDRALMLDYYRRAMALDTLVGLQLLGHLAEKDAWLAYHALAHDLAMATPLDPRPLLYRGLGLHHVGRSDLADSVFRVAKTLMPADELERLLDISVLLPPPARAEYGARDSAGRRDLERIFFTINDPIYLTEVEERRIEHISRILWADLKFGAPNALGAENDRGLILLRYGHPATWSQRRAFDIVGVGAGGMMQGQRYHLSIPTPVLSLRNLVIAWEYPVELDVRETGRSKLAFEFQRPMASRIARLDSASLALARRLEAVRPQIYIPRTITSVSRYAHQLARFRGEDPRLTSIEVYASPPLRVLGVGSGESVETGMFLFDAAWHLAWQDKRHTSVRDSVLAVSYRLEVQPGQYHYAVEARESGPDSVPRPLARTRLPVVAQEFPLDRVSVSDLLLADTIIQRVPVLARRDELVIVPSRRLEFDGHGSVHAYFEVYGLAPDEQGMGRYRAELAMVPLELPEPPEVSRRGRIAGAVRGLFRQPEEPDVLHATKQSWERASVVDLADDRVPEFLRIDLPALPPGDYGIEITVTDLHNGSAASSTRIFRVNEPPAPEPPG